MIGFAHPSDAASTVQEAGILLIDISLGISQFEQMTSCTLMGFTESKLKNGLKDLMEMETQLKK